MSNRLLATKLFLSMKLSVRRRGEYEISKKVLAYSFKCVGPAGLPPRGERSSEASHMIHEAQHTPAARAIRIVVVNASKRVEIIGWSGN
jgi:hypothetical protein